MIPIYVFYSDFRFRCQSLENRKSEWKTWMATSLTKRSLRGSTLASATKVWLVFFSLVFYFHVFNIDSYEKDVELRKQPSTSRKGRHEKAAKMPGDEFITSFFGLDESGSNFIFIFFFLADEIFFCLFTSLCSRYS